MHNPSTDVEPATDFVTDWYELKLEPGTKCRVDYNPDGSNDFHYTLDLNGIVAEWSKYTRPPKYKEDDSLPFYDVKPEEDSLWATWKRARNKIAQAVLDTRSGGGKKKSKEGKHTPPSS
jgi:hypothetical protein